MIRLPAAEYLMFRGEPFAEAAYCEAIGQVRGASEKYDPACLGYVWDGANPRIQLEPVGDRGYIELLPVRPAERLSLIHILRHRSGRAGEHPRGHLRHRRGG